MSEDQHRALVHRVVKARPRQNKSVEVTNRQADRRTGSLVTEHMVGRRTVPVDPITFAPVSGGAHAGLPVNSVTDVTDETGVEDGVNGLGVVSGAIAEPFGAGSP